MSSDIVTIIVAKPKSIAGRLLALWQYRGFYPFLLKEITSRKFKGTILGVWWLILRPLIPTVTAVVTFTSIIPQEHGGLPYVIFYFSGFLTWNIFHSTLVFMPRTLGWMQGIMRRTYFPKLLVPMASIGIPLLETVLMAALFCVAIMYLQVTTGNSHIQFGWNLLLLFPCLLMAGLLAWSIGTVTSVIALFVRDVIFTVSYFAQLFMFLTPVFYPISFIPEKYRWALYILNPMAELVEASRWSLTGAGDFSLFYLTISFITVICFVVLSVGFFFRTERYLSDEI